MTPARHACLVLVLLAGSARVDAQQIRGNVLDQSRGEGVAYAGVFLLDRGRDPVESVLSDVQGRYEIQAPAAGEYILLVKRLGYFDLETPLVALPAEASYALDLEVRPEPFRLDPLLVSVRNEELEDFLTLKLGVSPHSVSGYRAIQGARLAEAKLRAKDNTDLLRWLYIPVSHGVQVCAGRMGYETPDRRTLAQGERRCGSLYLDDHQIPNEHLEEIEMNSIAVVVTLGGSVHLYTHAFDWSKRPSR